MIPDLFLPKDNIYVIKEHVVHYGESFRREIVAILVIRLRVR